VALNSSSEGIYQRLVEMTARGETGVVVTVIKTSGSVPRHAGTKMICAANGHHFGTVGGGLAEATVIKRACKVLASGESEIFEVHLTGEHGVCGGRMDLFLEPLQVATPFYVVGAGHVGLALAKMGSSLRFRFTLIDDRPEFIAAAKDLPGVSTLLATPDELAGQLRIAPRAAVVVCSRGVDLDGQYLAALLRLEMTQQQRFVFFGSLGSATKAAHLKTYLRDQPNLAAEMKRIRLPVGLDLGVETPAEIALSILAEAQAVVQGKVPIHDDEGRWGFRGLGDL